MRVAPTVTLTDPQRQTLEQWARGRSLPARQVERFLAAGITGLEKDAPRPGRTPSIPAATVEQVIRTTTRQRPRDATHWSTRSMAAQAGMSEASVRRIWKAHGLKPHRVETFKVSNAPQCAEKLQAIVGL